MYDKSIAVDFRIWTITIPAEPTLVMNCLSPTYREEYDSIVNSPGLASNRPIQGRPNQRSARIPIDGYIVSVDPFWVGSGENGPWEQSESGVQYTMPVLYWTEKTWLYGAGTEAIIRVFFS